MHGGRLASNATPTAGRCRLLGIHGRDARTAANARNKFRIVETVDVRNSDRLRVHLLVGLDEVS